MVGTQQHTRRKHTRAEQRKEETAEKRGENEECVRREKIGEDRNQKKKKRDTREKR